MFPITLLPPWCTRTPLLLLPTFDNRLAWSICKAHKIRFQTHLNVRSPEVQHKHRHSTWTQDVLSHNNYHRPHWDFLGLKRPSKQKSIGDQDLSPSHFTNQSLSLWLSCSRALSLDQMPIRPPCMCSQINVFGIQLKQSDVVYLQRLQHLPHKCRMCVLQGGSFWLCIPIQSLSILPRFVWLFQSRLHKWTHTSSQAKWFLDWLKGCMHLA